MYLVVLPFRTMRTSLHRHYLLDHIRNPSFACALPTALLQQPSTALHPAHDFPRARIEPATSPCLLVRCVRKLQRTYADRHPPVLACCRIRCCSGSLDSCRLLVLLFHPRRPWGPRRRPSQRRQGLHSGREELLGAVALTGTEMS